MWILRMNMTNRSYQLEKAPERYKLLGGRGLTSAIISDEVDPQCHPLGPNNKLVFAPGIVTGTISPTSARISVGGKSPLTGGIKEANAGTGMAPALAKMRLKAVIIEGMPKEADKYWLAALTWAGDKPKVEFQPADEYTGQDLYEVYAKVFDRFGKKVEVAGIGTAGEFGYGDSGIAFNDMKKKPTRYAGRGGLGAVMGSKRLKFLVVDSTGAPGVVIANEELLKTGAKKMREALMEHAITKPQGGLNSYGTAILVNILNEAGGFPTRNFRSGRFEGAAKISGEAIFETNKKRMGKEIYNHGCSPGCIIQCSNTLYAKDRSEIASCVEYESGWAFGAQCGIADLDAIGEMVKLCNAYGLDTIEAGVTVGVAMDSGVLPFGDKKGAIKLLKEMGKGTPMGRILGGGAEMAAKLYGNPRSPTVKGQAMPAYEPRAVKGIGVTYATTTMGADHTAGYTIAPEILSVGGTSDPLAAEKSKADLSRGFQSTTAMIDSSGHCLFIAFAILDIPKGFEGLLDELNGMLGTKMTAADAVAMGADILRRERKFNEAAGFTKADDRLPEFMKYEKLPPHNVTNDLPDEVFDAVFGEM
ncbi:MAG: aldehyde ferredoxin oxidoreductase C-terminal domain-containing protein [Smithellaceae bacterium]|nr:aldehyde ferredoxin oxidoreductase C-terminal domain-containing protein [Smithellaceae bacterium]